MFTQSRENVDGGGILFREQPLEGRQIEVGVRVWSHG